MKILITGGTGFLGKYLCQYFLANNDEVTVLTRYPERNFIPQVKLISKLDHQEYFEIIINLAGEKISNKRWTSSVKEKIYDSRIETTRKIIEYIKETPIKPRILLSGSAIGYYGTHKERIFTEKSITKDLCFPSILCKDWERIALKANKFGVRTVILRTGVVLANDGGMIAELLPSFKLNLGAIIGDGKQFISWIHIDDYLAAIIKIIDSTNIDGPINLTSPHPCTNKEFSEALAIALNKKLFLRLPKFLIKLIFGEMGEKLLLEGQKIYPAKLIDLDFNYKFSRIGEALRAIFYK